MRSIQSRLAIGLFISLMLAFVALWLLLSHASRYLAEEYITTRLQHDSETLLTMLQYDNNGNLQLDTSHIDTIYQRPFSGHYYKILSQGQQLRSRSLWDQDLTISRQASGAQQRHHTIGPQQQPLLLLVSGFEKAEQRITIAVAEDLTAIEADLRQLQYGFTLVAILLLLLLVVVQGITLRLGMRPLDQARRELQQLSQGKLAQLTPEVPAEISPLVSEINHLLSVLEQRLKRSRNALGDLAHALKKPLTVLNQLSQDKTLAARPELQQNISTQLETMERQMRRILQRARLAGEGPATGHFDPAQDIPPLLNTLRTMYHHKTLAIESHIDPQLQIAADREDMLELIGNLLDNACKWSRHRVHLTLQANQGVVISVEDDGPGVSDDQIASLAQRGHRLDEQIEGHGLGLSISQEIVESLGGTLHLSRSEILGGLQVTVRLPG